MRKSKYNFDTSDYTCQNKACKDYHRPNKGHIRFAYMSGKQKKIAFLRCITCGKYFSENKGTIFFRRKISQKTICQILQNTVEGCGIRATARVFDISKDTVLSLVKAAGKEARKLEKKSIQKFEFQRTSIG